VLHRWATCAAPALLTLQIWRTDVYRQVMPIASACLTWCAPNAPEDVHWISPGDVKRLPWAACDVHGRDAVLDFIYRVPFIPPVSITLIR
jgi:hypothetical protein